MEKKTDTRVQYTELYWPPSNKNREKKKQSPYILSDRRVFEMTLG